MMIIKWRELTLPSSFVDFSASVLSTLLVSVMLFLCLMRWLELFFGVCG